MTRDTRWTVLAVVGWTLAVVGGVGGLLVRMIWPAPMLSTTFSIGPTAMVAIAALGLTWATVGAVLVIRRAENPVGRIMVVAGVVFAMSVLTVAVASARFADGTASGREVASVVGGATGLVSPALVLVFYLPFIFPTGRGHTPRWDAIGRGCLVLAMIFAVLLVVHPGGVHLLPAIPNPVGFGLNLRPVFGEQVTGGVGTVLAIIVAPLLILSVVSRYRVAARIERQQLKWFILANVITVGTVVILLTATVLNRDPIGEFPVTTFALAGATVPVAIGIAILRYHLFEIDRIVSRTIAYGIITAILIATYSAAILVLTGPLGNLFQGDTISVALSTLVVAAIFQPLRRRVQGVVDRSFDRARFDAQRTTAAFSDRLRDEVDITTVLADLDRTVRSALKPTSARLWLRSSVRR